MLAAQAMGTMDSSIVNVATRTIRDDLAASGAVLQTSLVGYTLTFDVPSRHRRAAGDDWGHRRMFILGLAGFVSASLLCGIAPDARLLA